MTEKRFRVHDFVKFDYSEIKEYTGEGYTDTPLRNDEVVDLLNGLDQENKQLLHDANVLVQSNQEYRKEIDKLKEALIRCAFDER